MIEDWTTEQREAFDRDGFLIVEEGFIDDETVELLRERFERLFEGDYVTGIRPDEVNWVAPKYAQLPELGRLTGRGNTANIEGVLKAKPDLIVDVGSTSATFSSLAERVQSQTGIPYVLLDGRLESTGRQIEKMGVVLGVPERGRVVAVGDGIRTDMAGAGRAGIDALFVASGLHVGDRRHGTLDAAEVAALFDDTGLRPVAALPKLKW